MPRAWAGRGLPLPARAGRSLSAGLQTCPAASAAFACCWRPEAQLLCPREAGPRRALRLFTRRLHALGGTAAAPRPLVSRRGRGRAEWPQVPGSGGRFPLRPPGVCVRRRPPQGPRAGAVAGGAGGGRGSSCRIAALKAAHVGRNFSMEKNTLASAGQAIHSQPSPGVACQHQRVAL